jgi:thioredoxin reductase (NADPH)
MNRVYEVIIIGGGPAGLTAGLYSCRAGMKTLLIEMVAVGGQVLRTMRVENYPGFPGGIDSPELIGRLRLQAEESGLKIETGEAREIVSGAGGDAAAKLVKTAAGEYSAPGIIVATGASPAKLGVPGEEEFAGRGVSYCAVCDGPLFRDKEVVVIGGGDTALEEAVFLARIARKVTIVHRRGRFRAAEILQKKIKTNDGIEVRWDRVVSEILGEKEVSTVKLKAVDGGKEETVSCAGVFIYVGTRPNSEFLGESIEKDEAGYVITDENMKTSLEGVFACGDVRSKPLKQIAVACGEGATAAVSCARYVDGIKNGR